MGSLLDYTVPTKDIEASRTPALDDAGEPILDKDGKPVMEVFSVTVRGLNVRDVGAIMLKHGETLNELYDKTFKPWMDWAKANDEAAGSVVDDTPAPTPTADSGKGKVEGAKIPADLKQQIKKRASKLGNKAAKAPPPMTALSAIKAMVATAPEAIGHIIAFANNNVCEEACEAAMLLPAPIQSECLIAIFNLTFKSDKTGKKWYEVLEEKMDMIKEQKPAPTPPSPTP